MDNIPEKMPDTFRALGVEPYSSVSPEELRNRFIYHRPDADQSRRHAQVSQLTLALANALVCLCPPGRNLAVALTELESVRMRAHAAIACDTPAKRPEPDPTPAPVAPPEVNDLLD